MKHHSYAEEEFLMKIDTYLAKTVHSLYRSSNIVRLIKSRRLRWTSYVVRMEKDRSAFKIVTVKPTGDRSLGRPRYRWEDNIRMNLKEIGISTRNWVDSAQYRDYCRALINAGIVPPGSRSLGVN